MGIIDSQSVEREEKGGVRTRTALTREKKIKGKKRHVLVGTPGLLMHAAVHAADIQDRDGGMLVMASLFGLYPFLLRLYANYGYTGPKCQAEFAWACRQVNLEIVRRSDAAASRFVVLTKRWIVERTIA